MYVLHYKNLQLYLRLGFKLNKTSRIRIPSITVVKTIYLIQHTKKNSGYKDGKALYTLMKNAIYCKTMKNLKKRIDLKLVSNQKDY